LEKERETTKSRDWGQKKKFGGVRRKKAGKTVRGFVREKRGGQA